VTLNAAKAIAIIPARGGSVRFKDKNIHPLCGRPLISYPIVAAINSTAIDRVIVSTDNEKIAIIAREWGAEVPFLRPKVISDENSPVVEAMIHCIEHLREIENYWVEYLFIFQPTTPLIDKSQIARAMEIIEKERPDSIVAVTYLDTPSHPYNIRVEEKNGRTRFWKGEDHYRSGEICSDRFLKAANMWVTSCKTLLEERRLEGERNFSLLVNKQFGMDIDYLEDLQMVEAWMRYSNDKID